MVKGSATPLPSNVAAAPCDARPSVPLPDVPCVPFPPPKILDSSLQAKIMRRLSTKRPAT